MRAKKVNQFIIIVVLTIGFIILMIPLLWCISLSFDKTALTALPEFSLIPHEFSTYNYEAAMKMIPFESRMIPLYIQYKNWGMLDSYFSLILGNFSYVYGMFFARQNIASIPDALRESAYLDGAGEWRIFFKIILPLSKPLIATLCILQVIAQWNSYLWPMIVIRSGEKQVLSVGVALFNAQENAYYYGPRMAVAVLSAIPLTILYLLLQKYIVQSIAFSGIKS